MPSDRAIQILRIDGIERNRKSSLIRLYLIPKSLDFFLIHIQPDLLNWLPHESLARTVIRRDLIKHILQFLQSHLAVPNALLDAYPEITIGSSLRYCDQWVL